MLHRDRHALAKLLPVLVIALCCSCGSGRRLYPVHGYVFANGKPAEGARIMFHPVDDTPGEVPVIRPSAMVDADGSFHLASYTAKDGAPPGEYQVTIDWLPPGFTRQQAHEYEAKQMNPDKLGSRYAKAKSSGLRATVTEGPNELEPFQLKN
jgi:hypothetical protein